MVRDLTTTKPFLKPSDRFVEAQEADCYVQNQVLDIVFICVRRSFLDTVATLFQKEIGDDQCRSLIAVYESMVRS